MNLTQQDFPKFDLDKEEPIHRMHSGLFVEATEPEHLEAGFASSVPLPQYERPHMGDGKIAPAQDWV